MTYSHFYYNGNCQMEKPPQFIDIWYQKTTLNGANAPDRKAKKNNAKTRLMGAYSANAK